MKPRRFVIGAVALCGTLVLAGWMIARPSGLATSSAAGADAVPTEDRSAPSLVADAKLAVTPQVNAVGETTDVATATRSATVSTDLMAILGEPKSIVDAELSGSSQTPPREQPPVQLATASASDPGPVDAKEAASSAETLNECQIADSCIDRYLWALYQRAPKEGTIKVEERRKVTVKKKGKTVTVTKSFTTLADEDFAWKDPKAAEKAGIPLMDYVIGGMDQTFKLRLYHTLRAAEEAGLSPGITSAFRDDYRQSIASGLKAATDRSYHGGSFRGGYGQGLAADIVSVKGETRAERWNSTEGFWKWIDAHGQEFGIGRPYLNRDPAHVAPLDGKEYAAHRGTAVQHAEAYTKKRTHLAVKNNHTVAKPPKPRKLASLQRN